MKQFFYFILLVAGLSSLNSCKDMVDEEGNPLIDLNQNTGMNGDRALFREITNFGIIAEYHYNGLLLSNVVSTQNAQTEVLWSGDKISQINFKGHLDMDNDGVLDLDSTTYTQLFTYGNQGRLTLITESRTEYKRTPGTPPGPFVISKKYKSEYNLTYSSVSGKLETIKMKKGTETTGLPFVYDKYSTATFTYLGDNVAKVDKNLGPIVGGVNDPATSKFSYEFTNYDDKISAYTLLPFAYKVSTLISTEHEDARSVMFSPNNPKRKSATDMVPPVPTPVLTSTNLTYDPQTYVLKAYDINYVYKPL